MSARVYQYIRENVVLVNNTINQSDRIAKVIDLAEYKAKKTRERNVNMYIDLTDLCLTTETTKWQGYDYLEAIGETLQELLEDATVFLVDQDGGEAGFMAIEDSPHYELLAKVVRENFKKQRGVL